MDAKTLSLLLMPLVAVIISGTDGLVLTPPDLFDVHVVGRICPDTAPNRYLTLYNDPDYGKTVVVNGESPTNQHWSFVNSTSAMNEHFFIVSHDLTKALMLTEDMEINGDGRVVRAVSLMTPIVHNAPFVDLGAAYTFEFAEIGGNGDPQRGLIRHVESGLVLQHRDQNSTAAEGVFAVMHASTTENTTVVEGFCTCTYPAVVPGRWWRVFD